MADKEQIRERSDIVEIVGSFVPLTRKGKTYAGLCPFHQEKTPSFNVDPTYQTYKCFGCGEGGDVFTFIEKHENMTFVEAAEYLARRAGLTLDRKGGPSAAQVSEREKLFEINAVAARYYAVMLDRASAAREYLIGRGLTGETIKRFQLGFALDNWDALANYLEQQKKDVRLAEKAGLVRRSSTGGFTDVFRNRIMFPIHDEQQRVIGFGGRAFGDDPPKYLNTGDTPLFNKSRTLYALPFARKKIGDEKQTLLMEGYMDVIAAHQAGFVNAVATLGTSLTDDHAVKLARLAPTVVLVYDGDSAGVKATLRASEILEKEGLQVRVARLPDGEDPDTMIKNRGLDGFKAVINAAQGRVEYQLGRVVAEADHESPTSREQMIRKIVAILATIKSRSARDVYVEQVWKYHGMSGHGPSVASEQLHRDAEAFAARKSQTARKAEQPGTAPAAGAPRAQNNGNTGRSDKRGYRDYERKRPIQDTPAPAVAGTAVERAERELVRALADPSWREAVLEVIEESDLSAESSRRFYRFVKSSLVELQGAPEGLADILGRREEPEFSLQIRQQLQEISEQLAKEPVNRQLVLGCAETLRKHRKTLLKRELTALVQGKTELSPEDQARYSELMTLLREMKGSGGSAASRGE